MADPPPDYGAIIAKDEEDLLHFLRMLCLVDPRAVGRDPLQATIDHEDITGLSTLAGMTGEQIGNMSYLETPGVDTSIRGIPQEAENRIRRAFALQSTHSYRHNRPVEWQELTTADLVRFQLSYDPNRDYPRFVDVPIPADGAARAGANPPLSPTERFKRSIKLDPKQFPTLKHEREWNDYQRKLRAVASNQGVRNVLNP